MIFGYLAAFFAGVGTTLAAVTTVLVVRNGYMSEDIGQWFSLALAVFALAAISLAMHFEYLDREESV